MVAVPFSVLGWYYSFRIFHDFQETACTSIVWPTDVPSGLAGRSANVPVEISLAQDEQQKMLRVIDLKPSPRPH
jgi:hypothetical protein